MIINLNTKPNYGRRGGKAGNDAWYQSSPFPQEKGLLVTDELINHARHGADSASVTAQLRPHSFNHLTARANTFQARFCLCRRGSITTHMLVHLPRARPGSVWHLSGFAFLLAVYTQVFSWTRNSLRFNYIFPPSIFPVHWPCKRVHGKQEALKLSTRGYPITLHLQKYFSNSLSGIAFLSFSFYCYLFDIFILCWHIALYLSRQQSKTIPIIAWFFLEDQQMLTFWRCCRVGFSLIYLPWKIQ